MNTRSLSPERIAAARSAAGMTQAAAAIAARVSVGTIRNAEAGAFTPRADALARMADAYGVRIDSLFVVHDPEADTASTACGTNQPHTDHSPVTAGAGPLTEG